MPDKSLGQHWLRDRLILEAIVDCAELTTDDMVLEIGPGLGTLTSVLLAHAGQVIAVEYDAELARKLPGQFPGKRLTVVHHDILSYDFSGLPDDFVVVGNIPYYITNKIVRKVSEGPLRPRMAVLLVQKEVAERLAAGPGEMSMLSVSAQVYHEVSLGPVVLRDAFTPSPKVDSQVVILRRRDQPLVPADQEKEFFRVVKAGYSARRKMLRSSLAGGLDLDKTAVEALLVRAGISPDARAQGLTIQEWQTLTAFYINDNI
ncbi:MAG: 16S rRNA (adenine(1518)-N(6)/adenine(1519)-N(6))-dimethyltransferase RsmA [Candidatus Saccharimonadales bacterium]|jgi:16S rRNA (adenine1518-N6/adenine1519-N6)-dimethyltransferase